MNEVPGRDPYGNAAADYANLSFEYRAQGKFHLARAAGLRAMRMGWSEQVAEVSREELSKYPLDGDDADIFEKLNEGAAKARNDSLGGQVSSPWLGNIKVFLFLFWPVLLPVCGVILEEVLPPTLFKVFLYIIGGFLALASVVWILCGGLFAGQGDGNWRDPR